MPKINITDAKGLFQNTGTGFEMTRGTANTSTVTSSSTLNFYNFYERVTLGSTESVCSGDLPAGAIVLGGNLTVVTADTNNIDITDVGSQDGDNDDDKYSGTLALDAQTAGGSVQLVPAVLTPNQGATSPALTHGSANGDGVVDLNLFYIVVT